MSLAYIFYIDENIIQVDNNEDIQFFGHNFVDVTLEAGRCIGKTKRHNLVLKMTVLSLKGHLPFITFLNSHLIIGAGEVQLGKSLCTFQSIKRFTDEWERIPILDGEVIKTSVVNIKSKALIRFLVK